MNIRSGRTYYAVTSGARSGGVGEFTFGLEWPDNTVADPEVTTGIVESASGSYTATRTAPTVTEVTEYIGVWYDPITDSSKTYPIVVSPTGVLTFDLYYTSPDDVRKYVGVTEDQLSDEELIQPIMRAQRDIDAACGGGLAYENTGLKFASEDLELDDFASGKLSEATCAQVEYRLTVGDDFMIREQYESQSGPGYGTSGKLKKVCGAAYTALGQGGFLQLHGRFVRGPQSSFTGSDLPRAN